MTRASSWVAAANGAVLGALGLLALRPVDRVERWQTRRLLGPSATERLASRVQTLARTRSEAVHGSATELRRIERDLHDGAQAHLVNLGMTLGMAEQVVQDDPAAARALLVEAREQARTATSELRAVVRGIHPPVLADRGLEGALRALAMSSTVPISLDVDLDDRPDAAVEAAAWFAVAEAVTNAVRHSGATTVVVSVSEREGRLRLCVEDDGRGDADPARGTGLRGIHRRLAGFDGTLVLHSPPGGPTVVEMELSCES